MTRIRTAGMAMTAFLLAIGVGPAVADPVARGTLTQAVAGTSFTGTFTFEDAPFTVFGTPVNFGDSASATFVGDMTYAGQITGPDSTSFHATSAIPGRLSFDSSTSFVCTTSSGQFDCSIVASSLTGLTGSVATGLPGGLVYAADATDSGNGTSFSGTFTINAFEPVATPTGSTVAVTTSASFLNSATGAEVPFAATVTYPLVTSAGATTVTAMSNVAGQLPANFSFNAGASFIDVSTTATVDTSGGEPITVCVSYDIAGAAIDPARLRLMHNSLGTWIDVTTSLDTAAGVICGSVWSLSPFGVAVSAGTPFGPDEGGFIPPDAPKGPIAKCENGVAKSVGKLIAALIKCHADVVAGKAPDDEPCEQAAAGKFLATTHTTGCRACTDLGTIASTWALVADQAINGDVYCQAGTPFGGDDWGNMPPDAPRGVIATCATAVGKADGKLAGALLKCQMGRAGGKLADAAAEDACKATAIAKAVAAMPVNCAPCLDPLGLASRMRDMLASTNDLAYCAPD